MTSLLRIFPAGAVLTWAFFAVPLGHAQEGWIWTKMESGTPSHLRDIKMSSAKFGVAVGEGSTVLIYDGEKWQPVKGDIRADDGGVANPFPGTPAEGGWGSDAQFDAVTILDSQSFWIGSHGPSAKQRGMGLWNGSHWTPRQEGPAENRTLALWSDGFDIVLAGRGAPGRINRYDGKTWKIALEGNLGFYRSIHGQANGTIWACGQVSATKDGQETPLNIVHSIDNGLSWQPHPKIQGSPAAREGWNAIYALSDSLLWAAGNRGKVLFWNGSSVAVAEAMPGPVGERKDLQAICALSPDKVWAVGDDGTVLFFNGQEWNPVDTGTSPGHLHAITPDGEGGLWIAGNDGLILYGRPVKS